MAAAKSLYEALLNLQQDAPELTKDSKNPHFGNKYVSLDALMSAVRPLLNKHGLVLVQAPSHLPDGSPALRTIISHPATDDGLDVSLMPLVLDKPTPQAQGSAITYARRYSIMALLGLVGDEDDDGNRASGRTQAKKPTNELEKKRAVFAIAKKKLKKTRPSVSDVAELFEVAEEDLSDEATLDAILEAHS